jgi:Mce-associated membrane protein
LPDPVLSESSRIRLNLGLWLLVLVTGTAVIVLGVKMWDSHADEGVGFFTRIGHTATFKWNSDAAGVGESVGSGVVAAVPAAQTSDQQRIAAVLVASTKFVNTFMNVDYKTMDSTFAAVRSMATGPFRSQFDKSVPSLRKLATRLHSVETATVIWAGYSSGDADSATVLLASRGTNSGLVAGKVSTVARYDRIRVDLQLVGSSWMTNNITFVAAS